jgi:hypothetical protein
MSRESFVTYALPLMGIGLMLLGILFRRQLSGRNVIDLAAPKLGLVLKADAFGLVVLLGFVMAASGLYFQYKDYESRLATLNSEVASLNSRVDVLRSDSEMIKDVVRELREQDLRLNLIFPPDAEYNPWKANVKGYVRKARENEDRLVVPNLDRGEGGLVVYFDRLAQGDRLYVIVEDQGNTWRSDDMVIPRAHLVMNRMP